VAERTARLLISCPDRKGLVATVAGFVARYQGNLLECDQHSDPQHGEFFMRVEIELAGFDLDKDTFSAAWTPVAQAHQMRWRIYWGTAVKRMAILVSKESHCLNDLLWRWRTGELRVEIPFVASNHAALQAPVEQHGLRFHHLPVTPETRPQQEERLLSLLADAGVDFVVLARYMQILSAAFVSAYPERIINIHHGFLPAFAGPKPYHHAYARGVKIIGATSHYVTEMLDQGPIIAQSTLPVNHRDTVDDLIRKGRDLERVVLATGVRLHVEDQVLVSQNKTVVFD
jgi:formyltetrahydrofolate deformylase